MEAPKSLGLVAIHQEGLFRVLRTGSQCAGLIYKKGRKMTEHKQYTRDEIIIALAQASGVLWNAHKHPLRSEGYLRELSVKIGQAIEYVNKEV